MSGGWRRLPLATLDPADALARAERLLADAAGTGATLAWSLAARPALVVGRAPGAPAVDAAACERAGVPVLRRGSGGGPVLWDGGLVGLDVVLPPGHPRAPADVVATYAWLGEALAAGLRRLGVPAERMEVEEARSDGASGDRAARLAEQACFGGRSPHEVVIGGRKAVGLCQARRRTGTLLQAGILLRLDASGLAGLLDLDGDRVAFADALRARAVGLEETLGGVDVHDAVAALETAVVEGLEGTATVAAYDHPPGGRAEPI